MSTSSGDSDSSSLLGVIVFLWFIFDTSARGLIYPSIIDFSWFEMAMLDCSELGEFEELLPGLVSECDAKKTQAIIVTCMAAAAIFVIFVSMFVSDLKKPILSESMRLFSMLEDEMNDVASHLIGLDKRLKSLENEGDTEYQIDEWEQELIEEDTE